jgi:hypothetical protein
VDYGRFRHIYSAGGIQDPHIVKLLLENIEEVRRAVTERQEQARYFYQTEVEKSE